MAINRRPADTHVSSVDKRELLNAARGRWPAVFATLGITLDDRALSGRHGPCPGCGGADRFRFDNRDGDGTFLCSQGTGQVTAGDGLALVQHCLGISFAEALNWVSEAIGLAPGRPKRVDRPTPPPSDKGLQLSPRHPDPDPSAMAYLRNLIADCLPVGPGGEVARYLGRRGLQAVLNDLPDDLREHPSLRYNGVSSFPALVGVVRDVEGNVVNVHRTYLADGAKAPVDEPRKLCKPIRAGATAGGAIQLYRPTRKLAVAEGIESALAVRQMTGLPTWAGVSATLMAKMEIPEAVREVEIWADNDTAGLAAADQLAASLRARGSTVEVRRPPSPGMDPLDWWVTRQQQARLPNLQTDLASDHCLCRTCGQRFNSTKAFDQHRVGGFPSSRRCLTPDEMAAARMLLRGSGWTTRTHRRG